LDHLRPEAPNAGPDEPHADTASDGHGASAATLPAPAGIPLPPHPPTRTDNAAAGAAGAADLPKRRSAPAQSVPGAAAPAAHSPLDLLFRSQN